MQTYVNIRTQAHDEDEDDNESDSSAAEEEPGVDTDESYMSLKALIEFMISSRAFDHLRKAFCRMVFPARD